MQTGLLTSIEFASRAISMLNLLFMFYFKTEKIKFDSGEVIYRMLNKPKDPIFDTL